MATTTTTTATVDDHMGVVGHKAKKLFENSRDKGKKSIELFIEGVAQGLEDVDKSWARRTPRDQQKRFDKVFEAAKELMVDIRDGGGCEDGLHISTFNTYKTIAKKVHIYHVRWQTAKAFKAARLRSARKVIDLGEAGKEDADNNTINLAIEKYLKAVEDTDNLLSREDKMDLAVRCVNDADVERNGASETSSERKRTAATVTLPDPDHHHDPLGEWIQVSKEYLEQNKLVKLVNADTPEADVVRYCLAKIQAHLRAKELGHEPLGTVLA